MKKSPKSQVSSRPGFCAASVLVMAVGHASVAMGQQYSVQSGAGPWPMVPQDCGVLQTSSTAPLTLSGCAPEGGCAGWNVNYATGEITVHTASIEHTSHGWTRPGWNSCGNGWPYGQTGIFRHDDIVISGPAPTVAVSYQLDYEFIMEMVHVIPDDVPWAGVLRARLLSLPLTGHTADTYVQVLAKSPGSNPMHEIVINNNSLGGDLEQLGQWKWRFSGRYISPAVNVSTGVPLQNFSIRVDAENSPSGQTGTWAGNFNFDSYLTVNVSLPVGEPVFILPDGFTANSATMGLVNNIITPAPCPGDITGNGMVDLDDFIILAGNFGSGPGMTPQQGDLNGDGFVDLDDFIILAGNFGNNCN